MAPQGASVVDSPLVVRFTSTSIMERRPTGWGAQALHLHAWVNGGQLMPAAADVRPIDQRTYEWTMRQVTRGADQTVHLGWADASHRAISAGSSPEVTVTIR